MPTAQRPEPHEVVPSAQGRRARGPGLRHAGARLTGPAAQRRSRAWLAAAAAGVLAAAPPAEAAARCLRVADRATSRCYALPGGTFDLSWTHSVERTEWRETYTVGPHGGLVLAASEFASAGAGLPDRLAPGEVFREEHGRMRIEGRRVPVGTLRVRLSGLSHHFLHLAGTTVDLTALFGEEVVTLRGAAPTTRGGPQCACAR